MYDNQEIFWIYQPYSLMSNLDLIPVKSMSLDKKMNAITRFFLLCILILMLLQINNVYLFFFIGLIIIITVYLINYTMSTKNTKESFTPCFTDINVNELSNYIHVPPPINNARFNEPPPYIAPSHNIDDWKQSTLVQHSAINGNRGGYSLKNSGYKSSDSSTLCSVKSPYYSCDDKKQTYYYCQDDIRNKNLCKNTIDSDNQIPVYKSRSTCKPDCSPPPKNINNTTTNTHCVSESGDLIEHCGYNPDKGTLAGMPHNQPMAIDDYYPTLKKYHQDINTQIIDPSGIYTTTEINEPQMTNLGISFAQQFQPIEKIYDEDGEVWVRKDPRLYKPVQKIYDYGEITPNNIYDPRSAGYGDSRRTYIDQNTGQPRFYYDDINAARETNFITRSKIDVYNFTNQTGVFDEHVNENPLEIVKNQVHNAFIDNGNDHRHSLQESLMRKGNEKVRQQRLAPLRRDVPTRNMK